MIATTNLNWLKLERKVKKLPAQLDQFLRNPLTWVFLLIVGTSAFIAGHDFRRPAPVAVSGIIADFGVCSHDAEVLRTAQAAGLTVFDTLVPETSKPFILIEKEWVPQRHAVCVTKATLHGYHHADASAHLYGLSALESIVVDKDDPWMHDQLRFHAPHLLDQDGSSGEPQRPLARFSQG